MKNRLLSAAALVLALVMIWAPSAFAANEPVLVYVTIANGELMAARCPVYVTDKDSDGALTINDALICAHEQAYSGGAAGYETAMGDYGLYITKLWGFANGDSYGYYKNNEMAMGLLTEVSAGDYVVAFVYTDPVGITDVYTYFSDLSYKANPGEVQELTLYSLGFDSNFEPVVVPVGGATITVDGKPTEYKTDTYGRVEIIIDEKGTHVISAESDALRLVPPACIAEIGDISQVEPQAMNAPKTGDIVSAVALGAALAAGIICLILVRKGKNENQ